MATETDFEAVEISGYDPAWPAAYERERDLIAGALDDLVVAIEHMGSTAVPGLGAKPIIDIMVGVRSLADGERCVRPLEGLGYEYKGEFGIPGRLYFRRLSAGRRSRQIHMVKVRSDFWKRHLLFRDYLREHPEQARDYYELKVRLAAEFGTDREGYTEAKTAFIESALARARAVKTE
ncbi:MAG: GrpB family protein [Dehalococcoidia bacterium]